MKIHSGIMLAAVLSANLFSSENLMQANDAKTPDFIDATDEAGAGVERLSNADSIVVKHKIVDPSTC